VPPTYAVALRTLLVHAAPIVETDFDEEARLRNALHMVRDRFASMWRVPGADVVESEMRDGVPNNAADAAPTSPSEALAQERIKREMVEKQLAAVLDLVAERHARKRRAAPVLPDPPTEPPKVDDVARLKARKALRRGGFVMKP
jgi:hypothetical protein